MYITLNKEHLMMLQRFLQTVVQYMAGMPRKSFFLGTTYKQKRK